MRRNELTAEDASVAPGLKRSIYPTFSPPSPRHSASAALSPLQNGWKRNRLGLNEAKVRLVRSLIIMVMIFFFLFFFFSNIFFEFFFSDEATPCCIYFDARPRGGMAPGRRHGPGRRTLGLFVSLFVFAGKGER